MKKYTVEQLMKMDNEELHNISRKMMTVNSIMRNQKGTDSWSKWDTIGIINRLIPAGAAMFAANRFAKALERAFGPQRRSKK